MLPLRDAQ